MPNILLTVPASMALPSNEFESMGDFLQKQLNRRGQGYCRYGAASSNQRYMTRMGKELAAYRATGNIEHLYNIANYCFLESIRPEHSNPHFDPTVKSATRKRANQE